MMKLEEMVNSKKCQKEKIKFSEITANSRNLIRGFLRFFTNAALIVIGINIKEERKKISDVEKIYSKYFGKIKYPSKPYQGYSCIISNHVSWIEILFYLGKFAPGFISKSTIKNLPIISKIAELLECLFLDRTDEKQRLLVAEEIINRQKSFINKESLTPLIIFPEGTLCSGTHLLKFKRGAFSSLFPIKPMIVKLDFTGEESISCGALNFILHVVVLLTKIKQNITFIELPTIYPTEYMLEKYMCLGKEKWQIYSEVVRLIYSEIGGFKLSDRNFSDMLIFFL
jgi:1-acyl-sn-glycerol-3-phosphate acyltransferase